MLLQKIKVVGLLFLSASAWADSARNIQCEQFKQKFYLSWRENHLEIKAFFTNYSEDLLSGLLSEYPPSLVKSYHCLQLKLVLPERACVVDPKRPELVNCQVRTALGSKAPTYQKLSNLPNLLVRASSCYQGEKGDMYGFSLSTVSLQTIQVQNVDYPAVRYVLSFKTPGKKGTYRYQSPDFALDTFEGHDLRLEPACIGASNPASDDRLF
jgi:hypothetical protein